MITPEQLKGATLKGVGSTRELKVISSKLVDGCIKVIDKSTTPWIDRYEPWDDIRRDVGADKWRVERPGDIPVSTLRGRTDADDLNLAMAQALVLEVKALMKSQSASKNKAIELLLNPVGRASQAPELLQRSKATIYRLLERDDAGIPLLVGNGAKGNRTRRYSAGLIELIEDELEDKYLVEQSPWNLDTLAQHISYEAIRMELLPSGKKLSRDFVSKVCHSICADPEDARMDAKDAIAAKAIAKQQIRVGAPLQRVEQDALHLPFVVKTPWGVSRDIWLVHSVDAFMSWPLGWYLVIGPPSQSHSFRALERAMFPKTALLEAMNIPPDRDVYGAPLQLIFDNGPEASGERMRGLARLSIKPLYCKARHAHHKPFIERLNRSLKKFLETLPGCTRFNGKDGMRDPEARGDKLMDIEELERWIVEWYFTKWIHTPLKRLRTNIFLDTFKGRTPAEVKTKVLDEEGHALPLPPNRTEWRYIQYERCSGTLSRKSGMTVDTFPFAGQNLGMLIKELGEVKVHGLKDPDDFRSIEVMVGNEGRLVRLTNKVVNKATPAYSFARAKEILKELPPAATPAEAEELQRRAFNRGGSPREQAEGAKKQGRRAASQATTARAKEHEAVIRAAEMPLTMPEPSSSAGEETAHDDVWETEDIGTFDTVDSASQRA